MDRIPPALVTRVRAVRRDQAEQDFLPPADLSGRDNVDYNRSVWDWYAEKWSDLDFRRRQLGYEGRAGEDPASVARLGEEWGRLEDAQQVIAEWVTPWVTSSSIVGEIGSGGGRVARMVAPTVQTFYAFDISANMIQLLRKELRDVPGVHFHVLSHPALPSELTGRLDFIYSFDVFVHLDLHVQWRYLQELHRVLKPGGRAFLHTANLTTDAGWERFAAQDAYRVEGFYFMTPEAVRTLAHRAGLDVEREQSSGSGNFYYERDYLVLLRKPAT